MADREKFKALIHYVCDQAPNLLSLGSTKLNKILWFAELDNYLSGEPISEVPFIKAQFGPMPKDMKTYLAELQSSGLLHVNDTEWKGNPKKEFVSLREPNLEGFSASQVSRINSAIQTICFEVSAEYISDVSHDDIYDMAYMGEDMPFYAAFGKPGNLTEVEFDWANAQLSALGMDSR